MITLDTNATPNGHRAAIMLEGTGVPYCVSIVDLAAGEYKTPAFLAINATGRIPTIVDDDAPGEPLALAEMLAIALYRCAKSGKLIPQTLPERGRAWQWAATVISGFGTATPGIFFARQLGETEHAKLIAKFIAGYLAAMDADLAQRPYLADDGFSFADALAISVIVLSLPRFGVDLTAYPALCRWRGSVTACGADGDVRRRPARHGGTSITVQDIQPKVEADRVSIRDRTMTRIVIASPANAIHSPVPNFRPIREW